MPSDARAKSAASGDLLEQVMDVLRRYVSSTTASSAVVMARRRTSSASERLDRAQLREILPSIDRSLRLFMADPKRVDECIKALEVLSCSKAEGGPSSTIVAVKVEQDVVRVRNEARELAVALGFSLTGRTRLATAVSELARNIVQYAGEGEIELKAVIPSGLEVTARDRGPGILNLDEIMTGNYRSKLGMGLGLRGVKQLADAFEVNTGAGKGTTVTFVLRVQ